MTQFILLMRSKGEVNENGEETLHDSYIRQNASN